MNATNRYVHWLARIFREVAVIRTEHACALRASAAAALHRRNGAALRDLYFEHRSLLESANEVAAVPARPTPSPSGLRTWPLHGRRAKASVARTRYRERQPRPLPEVLAP
ncbi:MAG: hypothetical protein ABI846_11145 [Rudaea sp.]